MPTRGLFIVLYDKETLKLYLDKGVFSQHMAPEEGQPDSYHHYRALADYGSARDGNHVFFFLKRTIYYGGQISGPDEHGSFYLNGQKSPLGREADAPLVWDETGRDVYEATGEDGVFLTDQSDTIDDAVCQPFLLRFQDERDLAGTYVQSDDLYFKLGEYPYPLPTNSIFNMGFCTMSPGETDALLDLLENNPRGRIDPESNIDVELQGDPVPYSPEYDIDFPEDATMESHLEASVIANPSILPNSLHPGNSTVCRQVPICPFKPGGMDRADVCYYGDSMLKDGTVPDTIIELKINGAGANEARQVRRYSQWLHQRHPEIVDDIDLVVYAPRFKRTFDDQEYIGEFADEVLQWEWGQSKSS
jgi:hypothetical protein